MRKLTLLLMISALIACHKSNTGPSAKPITGPPYINYSITREWWNALWLASDSIPTRIYDTILNTSYIQINGGSKNYFPTLSCVTDTNRASEPAFADYIDSLPVNSGDIVTICINMKHRWANDTSWNTWGSWVYLYQYAAPYGLSQHLAGINNAMPVASGGKGQGINQGICDGDTLSQVVTYTVN